MLSGGCFEEVTARAGLHRLVEVGLRLARLSMMTLVAGTARLIAAAGRESVGAGHPHVEDDDVGTSSSAPAERLGAVAGLADHLDVVLVVEDDGQPPPQPECGRRLMRTLLLPTQTMMTPHRGEHYPSG